MLGHIMAEIISHILIYNKDDPSFSLRVMQRDINSEIESIINLLVLQRQRTGKPLSVTMLRPYARNYVKSHKKWKAEQG